MRVAMGLAAARDRPRSAGDRILRPAVVVRLHGSTPTLFNSGTLRPQLSSCFLTTVADDLDGIFKR
jgi:ribonucleoside-diphosphate reductase alpha chain